MTSDTTRTTDQRDDVATLAARIAVFGPWALVGWRPRGGFAHPHEVDLRAIKTGLERLIHDQ
ncbi:hypothetical protein [Streptomyces kanamyceticus]|uniref:Uncharacterized protein n=1 Tax=Streptomyces kanamyceticus TaxID=1967 RepID=A0A5J6GG03_STRKN|nr:hypothetical protein [Streptomyces kanamyceticus]QEU92795.1 hypothetical protein CP970_19440 [Streptomyces kanamyceticus]